jgi:hypothetical protein
MWDDGFINEPYMQYKYNCSYKHWLIGQIDLVSDLINIIQKNKHILRSYRREFKIPDINSYTNKFGNDEYHIDKNGIIFVKSILMKHPSYNTDRKMEISYERVNNIRKCDSIIFYYKNDKYHYYTIDRRNSKIVDVKFIKQEYEIHGKAKNYIKIVLNDPTLISY